MLNHTEHLIKMADTCDKMGYVKIGNDIDNLIKSNSFIKVSQYTGFVGTCIRNSRFTSDCIRNKRVTSDAPMQELVMECLSEYQDVNVADKPTDKYASVNERNYIRAFLKQACSNGIDINTATRKLIETVATNNDIEKDIQQLKDVWAKIEAAGLNKNAEFKEFEQLIKQSGAVWDTIKNVGKGVANLAGYQLQFSSKVKEINRNLSGIQSLYNSVIGDLRNIVNSLKSNPRASGLIQGLNNAINKNDFNAIKQATYNLRQEINRTKQTVRNPNTTGTTSGNPASNATPQSPTGTTPITLNPPPASDTQTSGNVVKTFNKNNNKYVFAQTPTATPPATPQIKMNTPINVSQIDPLLTNIEQSLTNVQSGISEISNSVAKLMGSRATNVGGAELQQLSASLRNLAKNPFSPQYLQQSMTNSNALEQKLRQSIFQQQQQQQTGAGTIPNTEETDTSTDQQVNLQTPPVGGAGGGNVGADMQPTYAKMTEVINDLKTRFTDPVDKQTIAGFENWLRGKMKGTVAATPTNPATTNVGQAAPISFPGLQNE